MHLACFTLSPHGGLAAAVFRCRCCITFFCMQLSDSMCLRLDTSWFLLSLKLGWAQIPNQVKSLPFKTFAAPHIFPRSLVSGKDSHFSLTRGVPAVPAHVTLDYITRLERPRSQQSSWHALQPASDNAETKGSSQKFLSKGEKASLKCTLKNCSQLGGSKAGAASMPHSIPREGAGNCPERSLPCSASQTNKQA